MESHKMKWVRCITERVGFSERLGFTAGRLYPVNENALDGYDYPTTTDDDGDPRPVYTMAGKLLICFEEVTEDGNI